MILKIGLVKRLLKKTPSPMLLIELGITTQITFFSKQEDEAHEIGEDSLIKLDCIFQDN